MKAELKVSISSRVLSVEEKAIRDEIVLQLIGFRCLTVAVWSDRYRLPKPSDVKIVTVYSDDEHVLCSRSPVRCHEYRLIADANGIVCEDDYSGIADDLELVVNALDVAVRHMSTELLMVARHVGDGDDYWPVRDNHGRKIVRGGKGSEDLRVGCYLEPSQVGNKFILPLGERDLTGMPRSVSYGDLLINLR